MLRSQIISSIAHLSGALKHEIQQDVAICESWAVKRGAGVPNMTPYGFMHYPTSTNADQHITRLPLGMQPMMRNAFSILVYQETLKRLGNLQSKTLRKRARAEVLKMLDISRAAYMGDRAREPVIDNLEPYVPTAPKAQRWRAPQAA